MGWRLLIFLASSAVFALPRIALYVSDPLVGDLGTREQTTALCHAFVPTMCRAPRALLSYTNDNASALFLMPNSGVYANGVQVADSWQQLWNSEFLLASLKSTGVMPLDGSPYIWSGTMPNGGSAQRNCNEWTSKSNTLTGIAGRHSRTRSSWVAAGNNKCGNAAHVLCACLE